MNKDSIIVYASCGEGHKIAAGALAEAFDLSSVDILDFSLSFVKKFYSSGYNLAVRYFSFIWKLLFLLARNPVIIAFINKINFVLFARFYKFLITEKPKFIIATHFFPIYPAKIFKKTFGLKLIVIITDIGVHPLWVDECVDYYFVALNCTKDELVDKGVCKDKITVTGIPLRLGFKRKTDNHRVREKIGLDSKKTILMFSGATNSRFLKGALREFKKKFNFIIIYGRNRRLKSFLDRSKNDSVKYFSYRSDIWEFMDVASFVVTKPGGLTVFECLYKRKPMIFTHFIWGQEKVNMDAAIKLGAGFYVSSYDGLAKVIDGFENNNVLSRLSFDDSKVFSILEKVILLRRIPRGKPRG